MEKTRSRHRRARTAAGALGLGLLVLVGCAGTIDGRASVGQDLIGSVGVDPSRSESSTSTSPESSSAESSDTATSTSTDPSPTDDPPTDDPTNGTGTPTDPTSSAPDSSSTASSSSSTAGTTPTGAPDADGLTAPGTQLTYGAPAVLPFSYADAEGVFTVSGLTVTRGSEADWAALGVDTSDAQGEEPWFVRMTLTQDSGGDFSYTSVQEDLYAYGADGDIMSTVYLDDEANAVCPSTYAPEDFTVGQSYDTCVVLSVNLGETVDRVQFEGGFDADDPYYESPVVWKG